MWLGEDSGEGYWSMRRQNGVKEGRTLAEVESIDQFANMNNSNKNINHTDNCQTQALYTKELE